jgi:putative transposase
LRPSAARTKGSLSSATAKLMMLKLIIATSKTCRRLNGTNQLPKVIGGVRFEDGIEVIEASANRAA